jgi:predicted acyl esterase
MSLPTPKIEDYRHLVDHHEIAWIPMKDGRRLAARLVIPKDAEINPVPVILEYIPYRRRDGTRARDEETQYWFAAHGYACARVDISGSGDSDGLIEDEYIKREQDDCLEIIDWLANQSWSIPAVGMIGISWGGFNGLQVAARRPKALKAVISLCSTVDRYHDDMHFMGGCLLNDTIDWGSSFFTFGGLPPDPEIVGERKWRSLWRARLEGLELYPARWMKHQRRDAFWRHGSVIENYDAITCPVLAVSGWVDGYSNTVFKLVENLKTPCKGIVGPWGHKFPQMGVPGPAIGFLQECKRWWDRWLKDEDNGVENLPDMRLFLQDSAKPAPHYDERNGRWLGIPQWPMLAETAGIQNETFYLDGKSLCGKPARKSKKGLRSIRSPQTTGLAGGEWCAYGLGTISPELALDQREDDGGSLCFETAPLRKPLSIVGQPLMRLRVSSDKQQALVAVRLNDVRPDGSVARVSYGLLNLTHRDSHLKPTMLKPGDYYDVEVRLNEIAQVIPAGHIMRISISSSYWPMVWPSPETARLTIDPAGSSMQLPLLKREAGFRPVNFEPPEYARPLSVTQTRDGEDSRSIIHDIDNQNVQFVVWRDDGSSIIDDIGTETSFSKEKRFSINRDDPLTSIALVTCTAHFKRGKWDARVETETQMRSDRRHFYLTASISAFDRGKPFIERKFKHSFKRDYL